jgi:hypothetical protein
VPSVPLPEVPAAVLSSVALSDAFDCASAAIVLAESGDPAGMRAALLQAFDAGDGAFPAGSALAEALVLVLSAVWLVPEVTA